MKVRPGALGVMLLTAVTGTRSTDAAPPVLDTPRVVRAVAPTFPRMAFDASVIGYVLVDADVDAAGAVTGARIVRTPALLGPESVSAAQLWRFEPSTDKPKRTVRLTFAFDLVADPRGEADLYPSFTAPYLIDVRAQCKRRCDVIEKQRPTAFMGLAR